MFLWPPVLFDYLLIVSQLYIFVGKTALAVSLARYYGAACLNIDLVVQEAVSSGTSTASKQARELLGAFMESVPGTVGHNGEFTCSWKLFSLSVCKFSTLYLK